MIRNFLKLNNNLATRRNFNGRDELCLKKEIECFTSINFNLIKGTNKRSDFYLMELNIDELKEIKIINK